MAKPTAPGTVTAPSTGNPDTFASDADALVAWQVGPFYTYLVSLADWVDETATLVGVADGKIAAATPRVVLEETDAPSGQEQTSIGQSAGNFSLQMRNSAGTVVSTDYQIIRSGSGATEHRFAVGNVTALFVKDGYCQIYDGTLTREIGALSDTVTIADDAASALIPPHKSGYVFIVANQENDFPIAEGLYFFDAGATVRIAVVQDNGLFATSTGVLAGTTGADTFITVSPATNNRLYVENRYGSSLDFTVTWIGVVV